MSIIRAMFAAPINKVEIKQIAGKAMAEVSICRKNRAKDGEEATFTWLRLSIWSPPDWMTAKLRKGAFIAGSGEFTLRSYEKDGVKRQSAECNCQSFDVEVSDGAQTGGAAPAPEPAPAKPRQPAPAVTSDDEPPW